MCFHCILVKTFFQLLLSCKTAYFFRYFMIYKIYFYFFHVWYWQNLCNLELFWNSYCMQQKHCRLLRFISSCPFPSPIPKLSLVLGSCCHLCKLFAISKILPKLLWSVWGTGQQRMPCCFYVVERVFWTKPDLLMKKYFSMLWQCKFVKEKNQYWQIVH